MSDYYSVSEIADALKGDISRIVERFSSGRPVKINRTSMRIGSKGALVIQTSGPKRGSWFSHEANIGGGPIELIQHLNGCTLEKAIETASQMTGLAPWPDDAPS
ncbi:MAG TPA: hypothetical protein PK231_13735, partial [Acidocella sp.]|nr:hypothetical protein [Acidocella sp.]